MTVCAACGRDGCEVEYRVARQRWLCLDCHLDSEPPDSPAGITPCAVCSEPLGARYAGLCWSCWSESHPEPAPPRPRPGPEWITFRKRILAALDCANPGRFLYGDRDQFAHGCPVCRSDLPQCLIVTFHGRATRADFDCSRGCRGTAIAAALERLTTTNKERT